MSAWQVAGYIISTAAFTAGIFVCIVAFLEWLYPEKDTTDDLADAEPYLARIARRDGQ